MTRITFFAGSHDLGTYPCPEQSSQLDRNAVARDNGITYYTKFVLDNGRVTGYVDNGLLINWCQGTDVLIHHLNINTMEENNSVQDNYARPMGNSMPGMAEPTSGHAPTSLPPRERNKARRIEINEADNGYIVQVGCQTLVFEAMDTLIEKLTAYLKNPNAAEEAWMAKGIL